MKNQRLAALFILLFPATLTIAQQPQNLPEWAYPAHFSAFSGNGAEMGHPPGSKASFTLADINNVWFVPDWYPDAHPPMPEIVSHGRRPDVVSCGHCHLPNGQGRPENASVAGLPEAYIVQQMADFKSGARQGSDPKMVSVTGMIKLAKAANDEDVKAAAAYFSSIKPKQWIRVVEVEQVPKTEPRGGMMVVVKDGGMEPIGDRVIEVSEDVERTELRDPNSGFIAYVPKGSLAKGKQLVTAGAMPCTMCHGPNLQGTGSIPSIAGRSPSQMTRQLIDFQNGNRNGQMAAMMKPVVDKLSMTDIVNIVSYLAAQAP
jgi:cytochrome c553